MSTQTVRNTLPTKPELTARPALSPEKKAELDLEREKLLRLLPLEKLFTLPNLPPQIFDDNEPICCPFHPDEKPSCKLYTDGPYPAWWCFSEQRRYTAWDAIKLSLGPGCTYRQVRSKAIELAGGKAALAGLKLTADDLKPTKRQSGEPPRYPPPRDVAGLLLSPLPAPEGWIEGRGITPAFVNDHGLAFGCPEVTAPSWMRSKRGTWRWRGYGICFPVLSPDGRRVSVRARQDGTVGGGSNREQHKVIVPRDYDVDETIHANGIAWSLLLPPLTDAELELLPFFFGPACPPQRTAKPQVIDIAEGEGDYLVRCEMAEPGTAVFGLHSGSWCQAHADKIPDGVLVRICTHSDEPGMRYQRFVISTFKGRCQVKVRHQRLKLVDRWAGGELRRGYKELDEVELLKELGREKYRSLEWHDPLPDEEAIPKTEHCAAAPAPVPHEYTDLGNAKRFVDRHGQNIRYCAAWDQWLIWDGKRWEPDEVKKIELLAADTVESILSEPLRVPTPTDTPEGGSVLEAPEAPSSPGAEIVAAKAEVARVAAAKAEAAKAAVEAAAAEGPAALLKAEAAAAAAADRAAAARAACAKAEAKYGQAGGGEAAHISRAMWAHDSQNATHLRQVWQLAQSRVPVRPAQLDADPWLLNTRSGVIDLRTGKLQSASRELLQTKIVEAEYSLDGPVEERCPTWIRFLRESMGGNLALVDFLRLAVGYSLTGSAKEQKLFVLLGPGGSGKGTLVNTLQQILGGYARSAPRTLVADRKPDEHPTDLDGLEGYRFVVVSELKKGSHLATDTVKMITSEDTLAARPMGGNFRDKKITHKLWVMSQYMPRVDADDSGIWRRVLVIPFDCPPEKVDDNLPAKLRAEWPGILAWAVMGCLEWQRAGRLNPPEEVYAKTAEVRATEDVIGSFLEERCEVGRQLDVTKDALYDAYVAWCDRGRHKPLPKNQFGTAMEVRGFKSRKSGPIRYTCGLTLLPEPPKPPVADSHPSVRESMRYLNPARA